MYLCCTCQKQAFTFEAKDEELLLNATQCRSCRDLALSLRSESLDYRSKICAGAWLGAVVIVILGSTAVSLLRHSRVVQLITDTSSNGPSARVVQAALWIALPLRHALDFARVLLTAGSVVKGRTVFGETEHGAVRARSSVAGELAAAVLDKTWILTLSSSVLHVAAARAGGVSDPS